MIRILFVPLDYSQGEETGKMQSGNIDCNQLHAVYLKQGGKNGFIRTN